jgi:chromosome segregation ATPase
MRSSRVERPEQLTLEVGGYSASVMSIAVGVVFFLVVVMLLNSNRTNNNRAEDWRRRAVAAEEVAGGLRVVLADRSRTLNQRTRQANILIDTLASSRGALRETKGNLGALARRQRELASEKAAAETERRRLQAQRAALDAVATALAACSQGLEDVVADARNGQPKAALAKARPFLAQCNKAQARLRTAQSGQSTTPGTTTESVG